MLELVSGYLKRLQTRKNIMGLFQFNTFAKSRSRRAVQSSVWGSGLDRFEDRTLLSGIAIYPQPAEVATADAGTAAAPPADFSGDWNIDSSEGSGTAAITQNGNQVHVVLDFYGTIVEVDGKVKGDNAKIKVKQVIESFNVKGKIKATLTSPSEMSGTAKAKVAGLGKYTVPFTGYQK